MYWEKIRAINRLTILNELITALFFLNFLLKNAFFDDYWFKEFGKESKKILSEHLKCNYFWFSSHHPKPTSNRLITWVWSDTYQTKTFRQIFLTLFTILAKNDRVPGKYFALDKIFDFKIFGLRYVFKYSESISTPLTFDQKNLTVNVLLFWPYWPYKTESREKILHGKKFRFRDFWFKIRFETF